ncbi:HAD family hydrolase [Methylopila turkensis]|uniref:Beta-phosphoglucomutase n=1 Tax=Methylopila turkensis TaxID=1437816 RepID=A0A9W6JNK0_9HYPH|nr:HAD family phosphatase [Methylopila turkensis]GLK80462.1 beta-phosphoglucomutase [Methylopila turkensis]
MTPVRGLIFDMDGTLVDNMAVHDDAWEAWHAEVGLAFDRPSFFRRTAGRTNPEIISELFPDRPAAEIAAMGAAKEAIYRRLYAPRLAAHAGFAALMAEADRRGVKAAVATAAPPENVDFTLDGLGLRDRFVAVVQPSMGYRGKPHPDMFLAAAEKLGVSPAECLVFEDAPLGVEAARRGGMPAVAITTTLPAEAFAEFRNVRATAPDFVGLDLDALFAGSA